MCIWRTADVHHRLHPAGVLQAPCVNSSKVTAKTRFHKRHLLGAWYDQFAYWVKKAFFAHHKGLWAQPSAANRNSVLRPQWHSCSGFCGTCSIQHHNVMAVFQQCNTLSGKLFCWPQFNIHFYWTEFAFLHRLVGVQATLGRPARPLPHISGPRRLSSFLQSPALPWHFAQNCGARSGDWPAVLSNRRA